MAQYQIPPTSARTTFERQTTPYGEVVVPLRKLYEWQIGPNGQREFRCVRISEHHFRADGSAQISDCDGVSIDWPAPSPLDIDPRDSSGHALITNWEWYPKCDGEPFLAMNDTTYAQHFRDTNEDLSPRGHGLPEDYLEFWLGTDDEEEVEVSNAA